MRQQKLTSIERKVLIDMLNNGDETRTAVGVSYTIEWTGEPGHYHAVVTFDYRPRNYRIRYDPVFKQARITNYDTV